MSSLRSKWQLGSWVILSLLGFLVVAIALSCSGRMDRMDPLFLLPFHDDPKVYGPHKTPIQLTLVETKEGVHHHILSLESEDDGSLLTSKKLALHISSAGNAAEVISARMVFTERSAEKKSIIYLVKERVVIDDRRHLSFTQEPISFPMGSHGHDVTIDIFSTGIPNLALWGYYSEKEPISRLLWMPVPDESGKVVSIYGWREQRWPGAHFSKAQLLAYTWGWGVDQAWIVYLILGAACLLWFFGIVILRKSFAPEYSCKNMFLGVFGPCSIFLSIGLTYAVLVPPFQAPDESDHFLTYAALNHREDLAQDALKLANRGHFERMKFRGEEKFTAYDIESPMSGGWASHVTATDINRSPLAQVYWSYIGNVLSTGRSSVVLFLLRLANIFTVFLCLAFSLIAAVWALRSSRILFYFSAPVLMVPAISFYSMAISNYPFLIGGYILQAVALGLLWHGSLSKNNSARQALAISFLAGLGIILAMSGADAGVFSLAFWGVMIPSCAFLQGACVEKVSERRKILVLCIASFLFALLLGWAAVSVMSGNIHILPFKMNRLFDAYFFGTFLGRMGLQLFVALAFTIPLLLFSGCLFYAGRCMPGVPGSNLFKIIVSVLIFFGLGFVLFAPTLSLPDIQGFLPAPPLMDYVSNVLFSLGEGFGPGRGDWLVVDSFWGSFGWLDTPAPDVLLNILRYGTSLGVLLLIVRLFCAHTFDAGLLIAQFISLFIFVIAIAVGYYVVGYNVHGRYLIGFYLFVIVMACEGYRWFFSPLLQGVGLSTILGGGVLFACMGIQCTVWLTILNRYF